MKVNFTHLRNYVYTAEFDISNVNDELVNENWRHTPYPNRLYTDRPYGPKLKELCNFISSDQFRQQVLNTLYSTENFYELWRETESTLFEATTSYARLLLDRPGHETKMHLDNRSLVAVGMCYFIPEDIEQQSTVFFTDKDQSNPMRIATGYGLGWMAANTHDNWHDGYNRSASDRYSVMFGIRLKL